MDLSTENYSLKESISPTVPNLKPRTTTAPTREASDLDQMFQGSEVNSMDISTKSCEYLR